jgi:electron transport complex protein RnfC
MPLFKLGKTHVPHRKNTAGVMPMRMPPPAEVLIPMVMHIGAAAKPLVSEGEPVFVGQKIAEAGGYVSAPIHASISGYVKGFESIMRWDGR